MERATDRSVVPGGKDPVIKRVFVGAWDGTKKVLESQSPEAWGKRISNIIETRIVPNLPEDAREWAEDHREEIREAATYAGVGITTAEVVAAMTLGAKMIDWTKYRLELARARRMVTRIPSGEGLPDMPVTVATSRTYALKPETDQRVYDAYFAEPSETWVMHRGLNDKWRKLYGGKQRIRVRSGGDIFPGLKKELRSPEWMRRRLNGTIVTFADLMEDQTFRTQVKLALADANGDRLSDNFMALFREAYQQAAGRFEWDTEIGDWRQVWSFWNGIFGREGIETIRRRATRFVRPTMNLPDQQLTTIMSHLEGIWKPIGDKQLTVPTADIIRHPSYVARAQIHRILTRMKNKRLVGVRGEEIKKMADKMFRGYTWKNPVLAARFWDASWKLYGVHSSHKKELAVLIDSVWDLRGKPAVAELVRKLYEAQEKGNISEARVYGTLLLRHALAKNPNIRKKWHKGAAYYEIQEHLKYLYDIWIERFKALGLSELFEYGNTRSK